MKVLALAFLCALMANNVAFATTDDATAKASADAVTQQISTYQVEASKLGSAAIFGELEKLRKLLAIKQQSNKSLFILDDDTYKAVGYAAALQARRKAGDPTGAYYHGLHNLRVCGGLQSADKDGKIADTVKQCILESLESFKVASAAHMGEASFNIGRMYENGVGVMPSKLVAADWFTKAARQFIEANSREEALMSIEAALTVEPNFPEAVRLKSKLVR